MPQNQFEDYLGDGVYVSFDGDSIVLDLRGQDDFTKIALEPAVLTAFDRYRARLKDHLESLVSEETQ